MKFCHEKRDSLGLQFLLLSRTTASSSSTIPIMLPSADNKRGASSQQTPDGAGTNSAQPPQSLPAPPRAQVTSTPHPEFVLIQTAMRKLREAIVSSRRADMFAQQTYLFL